LLKKVFSLEAGIVFGALLSEFIIDETKSKEIDYSLKM